MPISPEELRRLAESESAMWNISGDFPCGSCGYCLRGLPIRGRCPEGGTPYNSLHQDTLEWLQADDTTVPVGSMLACLLLAGLSAASFVAWGNSGSLWSMGMGLLTGLLAAGFGYLITQRLRRYLKFRAMIRRLQRQTEEGE